MIFSYTLYEGVTKNKNSIVVNLTRYCIKFNKMRLNL